MNNQLLTLPTKDFLSNYRVAYQFVENASLSHADLWKLIKACQNHIAGEKPIPPDKLKDKGMAWASNFNFGKARAKIEKGVAESTAKISSALALGYTSFRSFKESDRKDPIFSFLENTELRGIVASNVGMCLANTLARENRLSGWLNEVEYPAYAFGFCALTYDPYDWMPEPVHPLNIAFKPDTKPEKIPAWVTFKKVEATDLYKYWVKEHNAKLTKEGEGEEENKQAIAPSGWNIEGLEAVLLKAFKGKIDKGQGMVIPDTWADVMPAFRANPSEVITTTDIVKIAKIFYVELDQTLSEVYIPWANDWQTITNDNPNQVSVQENDVNYILFKKNHGPFNQRLHISIVRDSGFSETGFIQDYRGVAKYAVEDSIRYNRTRNSAYNKLIFIGSPMFESDGTQDNAKFKVTVSQGFIILPPAHKLVERQPSFDIGSHINILRFDEQEYLRDTQQYDPSLQGRLTTRPNKDEVQQVSQEVQMAAASKNNIKLKDYAAVFQTVLEKIKSVKCEQGDPGYEGKIRFYALMKEAIPFLKSDADVNKLLGGIESFVLEPIVGDIDSIMIGIQMAETPFARNRLRRMLLIAKGFPIEEVNTSIPLITDKMASMSDEWMAAVENDMFVTTNEVYATGIQDHIVHLNSHFHKVERFIKGFQEGALDPLVTYKYLENILAHTMVHIEMLGEDPTLNKQAMEYLERQKMYMNQKKDIMFVAQRFMREQEQAAAQVQVDPETQAKIASKAAETQSDMQRKDWIASERTKQREEQMQQTHDQQMRRIDLEHERKLVAQQQNR